MIEKYECVIIKSEKEDIFIKLQNVDARIEPIINKGVVKIEDRSGINLVGGENDIIVFLINVKDRVKETIENKNVDLYLLKHDFQDNILNVKIKYQENNIVFSTKEIKRTKINE